MLKKKFILAGIVLFMFGLTTSSFAQMKCAGHSGGSGHRHNSSDSTTQTSQEKAVAVGNKVCPVLNEKIDKKNKVTYEYGGKIYNFCCSDCVGVFKKDPGKYIEKVEEELEAQSRKETTAVASETEMATESMSAHSHSGHSSHQH